MITDALLAIVFAVIDLFTLVLPEGDGFPPVVEAAVTEIAQTIHIFDDVIPVTTIFDALTLLLTVNIALFAVWSVIFIMRFIRGN